MNVLKLNSKCCNLMSFGIHAAQVTFGDGTLCAACGGLYGMVFGGFGAMMRHELSVSKMLSITVSCAMIGFAVGVAVGVIREFLRARTVDRQSVEIATRRSPKSSERQRPPMREIWTRGVTHNSPLGPSDKIQTRITGVSG